MRTATHQELKDVHFISLSMMKAGFLIVREQYEDAIPLLQQANEIRQINVPVLGDDLSVLGLLAKVFELMGDHQRAHEIDMEVSNDGLWIMNGGAAGWQAVYHPTTTSQHYQQGLHAIPSWATISRGCRQSPVFVCPRSSSIAPPQ